MSPKWLKIIGLRTFLNCYYKNYYKIVKNTFLKPIFCHIWYTFI